MSAAGSSVKKLADLLHWIPRLTTKAWPRKHVRDKVDITGRRYLYLRKSVAYFDSSRKDTVATGWEDGSSHLQQIRSSSCGSSSGTFALHSTTATSGIQWVQYSSFYCIFAFKNTVKASVKFSVMKSSFLCSVISRCLCIRRYVRRSVAIACHVIENSRVETLIYALNLALLGV